MNRHISSALLMLACACSAPSWAGPSLCVKGETVFFNCPVKSGKIISLCGSIAGESGSSSAAEWLLYRFGRPGTIELSFP